MALVEKVLKGADFERRLVSRTDDDIRIDPLYTRQDAIGSATADCRSAAPPTLQVARRAWSIAQTYIGSDPVAVNAAVLDDLQGGVTGIGLQVASPGSIGLSYDEPTLGAALEGVLLDACSVRLIAGEYTPDAAGSLLGIWRSRGIPEGQRHGALGYDPLSNLAATGALYHPIERSLAIAADLAATSLSEPGLSSLRATGETYHEAGSTEAQELACVIASCVAYLRACEAAGLSPPDVLPKIVTSVAIDADQFLGIAKLRALKLLIGQVGRACGATDASAQVQRHATTSQRMMARRDPWVNLLRTTMACAAAGMGGADMITVLPFTWALGQPDAFARRLARNTQIVLMEESGLARVADPAAGSWYVERLTAELASAAWSKFQDIERRGGMADALTSGFIQDEIEKARDERIRRVATGRLPLTGSSAYPKLGDDGILVEAWPMDVLPAELPGARARRLTPSRLAAPFEALRDAADRYERRVGHPPRLFLASLGPLAVHGVRTTWMCNFLAAGGVEGLASPGFTNSTQAAQAFAESGAIAGCLCSSDEVYAELGEATAGALKAAGAKTLFAAGRPKSGEAELRAAGVDGFITAGSDAIETLQQVHAALGVA